MDCVKCAHKDIKYRCIGCKSPICNVCSKPCTEETPGYSEEAYCVGKCDECQHGRKRKLPDLPTAAKSQQSSLSFYFTKKTKTPVPTRETPVNTQQQLHYDCNPSRASTETRDCPSTAVSSTPSAKKTRALTVAAANRWKTTSLAEHLGSEWLVINADKGDHVVSLNCSVCKTHADKLKGMKNFLTAWAFTGSTNLHASNAKDHARGEPHKRALDLAATHHIWYQKHAISRFCKDEIKIWNCVFHSKRRNAAFKIPANFKAGGKAWCWHWESILE